MPSNYQSFSIRPTQGGDLMTIPSSENPGLSNYTTKRDWRRVVDQEWQREGHVNFAPAGVAEDHQPFPNYPDTDEPITLTHQLRAPNGRTAFIVGTPTTLYRFFTEPGGVYEPDVYEDGVYSTVGEGEWLVIGSGYSTSGHRWEAKNIAGVAYFNNGIDLVQTYNLNDFEVRPHYELREQGIARVETIAEFYGTLFCADITEINGDSLASVMNGADPYGPVTDSAIVERFAYRAAASSIGEPDRFGSMVNVATVAGNPTVTLEYPMRSLEAGMEVLIVGAGTDGTNHTSVIVFASGASITLETAPAVTLSAALLSRSDRLSLTAGYNDLQDDSSAVLRMEPLQDRLVVFKDTGFFIGVYTGDPNQPFAFTRTYTGPQTLFWRWTVISVNGDYLLFAGRFGFLKFSLTTQKPEPHEKLTLCENVFYDTALEENEDLIFAADNGLTSEAWFCFPSTGEDHALIYDYKFNTTSTSGRWYTAAATVKRPGRGIQAGPQQDWFVAGNSIGTVLQYSLTAFGASGYTLGSGYDSGYDCVLEHGWGSLGRSAYKTMGESIDDFNEKDVRCHTTLLASRSPGSELTIRIETAHNPSDVAEMVLEETLTELDTKNAVELFARGTYFRDRLTARGGSGVRLSARVWEAIPIGSRATSREAE